MSESGAPILAAEGLRHELPGGRVLFDAVDLSLGRETVGLVGRNGAGKTTLLRMLAGEVAPARGRVVAGGPVAWLPQRRIRSSGEGAPSGSGERGTVADALGVAPRLAALQRVEAGGTDPADFDLVADGWDLPARMRAELDRIGLAHVEPARAFATLSGGERTRVALARLSLTGADAFLLDEPTNDLDRPGRADLAAWIAERREGVLIVTHDRALLRGVDRIVELTPAGVRNYGGGWELFIRQREDERRGAESRLREAESVARRARREAQARIERQERNRSRGERRARTRGISPTERGAAKERSSRSSGRVGEMNAARVGAAREELGEARARLEEIERIEVSLQPSGLRTSRLLLEARGVGFTRPGARGRLFGGVDLLVRGPERIAVTGVNGAGKTTLLRILAGDLEPTEGAVLRRPGATEMAWLDQRATLLGEGRTVLEAFRAANPDLGPSRCRHALARYLFEGAAALAAVDELSGGERIRAALACTVGAHRPPQLLFLDEPTNHLDLESLAAVESILRAYDGALVVVSHDQDFLGAIDVQRRVELGMA